MAERPETTTRPARRLPQTFGWTFLAACTALVAIGAVHYYSVYRSERVGRETAERANLVGDRAQAVTLSHLQDKSERYYFAETLRIAPGDIYISPLDLNMEQGRIERPFRPVMRFATPIFDDRGETAGIVVLNYLGQRLLDRVRQAAGPISDHLHLLEPRGYWLQGPNPTGAWGFMLGSDRTFGSDFPEEWRRISQRRRGQLLTAKGLFTFATVSPHPVAHAAVRDARADLATRTGSLESPYDWKLFARLPLHDLALPPGRFLKEHIALYSAMLTLLALGSFLLARARVHHRQAELQRNYERRFRRTLEDIRLAAVALDSSGQVTFCNRFFLDLTSWRRSDIVGKPWLERVTPEEDRERMAALLHTLDTPELFPARYTCEVLTRQGERRLLAWHNSLNTEADGRPIGVTAIGEDITERKRLEQEVELRNRELARAQALAEVGRMATMIAHDLRNPLSSVKIALQVLSKQDTPNGESQELRAIAREQVTYMEAILSDMLAYARPRAPALEWLNADRLLQTAVGLTQRRLDEQGVALDTHYQSGLPTFPGDPNQLRQVFSNLIINAIQATEGLPRGERRIHIRTGLELASEGTRIRIEVCDNGRGIDGLDTARLFEPFHTTRAKGTGLGLAIVRKILDQHQGSIDLHPNPPRGTCATVLLPTVPEKSQITADQNSVTQAES